ncbi:MAG: hypothetical protein ACD_4C00437G0001 [uncultured bacterium (gcode 4)]|uniref:Uncharacterized protein n=1 Tax=uncultured bacterium (gcode 4) TaxID=1234023 RepID=K2FTB7_9BACT|nr:MAG: hypothetical protein ACD_4C00437G0001 [uncultured bacterium (gcode 4)]
MYTQNLLAWWKNYSIEWILNKHFKILNEISSTSLIQSSWVSKNNFSLAILDNLKLPNMVHLWVVVSKLPVLVINGKSKETGNEKNDWTKSDFIDKETYSSIFTQHWLRYDSQNDLSADETTLSILNCMGVNTDECKEKLEKIEAIKIKTPSYEDITFYAQKSNYLSDLDKDLMMLSVYSDQIWQKIQKIQNVAESMKRKK